MKYVFYLILICAQTTAYANWYCHEVASEKNGDTINVCGIGEAKDEDSARKEALRNAYKELDLICSHSSDCAGMALDISPLRTDCKKVDSSYRCHRGITATITKKERDLKQKALLEEVFVSKKVIQVDTLDSFVKSSIVDIDSSPSGATVYVDGVEICKTPCSQEINQGEHKLQFELSNYDFVSKIIFVSSGRQSFSQLLTNTYGYLSLSAVPSGAVVKIDNKQVRSLENIRLTPNEHVVTIESSFHQPWHKKFQIEKGEIKNFDYDAKALKAYLKLSAVDSSGKPLEATILVNQISHSEKTPAAIEVPAGNVNISLEAKGYTSLNFNLNLDVGQKKELKKTLVLSHLKDWNLYFGLGFNSSAYSGVKKSEKNGYTCCVIGDVSLQRSLTKNVSIKGIFNFISGSGSDKAQSYNPGSPNEYKATSSSGYLTGVAIPIYLKREERFNFYVAPEAGVMASKLHLERENPKATKVERFSQKYSGISVGSEWLKKDENFYNYGFYLLGGGRMFGTSNLSSVESSSTTEGARRLKGNFSFYLTFGFIVSI